MPDTPDPTPAQEPPRNETASQRILRDERERSYERIVQQVEDVTNAEQARARRPGSVDQWYATIEQPFVVEQARPARATRSRFVRSPIVAVQEAPPPFVIPKTVRLRVCNPVSAVRSSKTYPVTRIEPYLWRWRCINTGERRTGNKKPSTKIFVPGSLETRPGGYTPYYASALDIRSECYEPGPDLKIGCTDEGCYYLMQANYDDNYLEASASDPIFCARCHKESQTCPDLLGISPPAFVDASGMMREAGTDVSAEYYLCHECEKQLCFTCPECDQRRYSSNRANVTTKVSADGRRLKEQTVCRVCAWNYKPCHCCGHNFLPSLLTDTAGRQDQKVCKRCLLNSYRQCPLCSDFAHHEYMRLAPSGDAVCLNCHELAANPHGIHGHSFRPKTKPLGHGPHFFGVELEVECPPDSEVEDIAARIAKLMDGFVYIKRDGSLRYGMEIVTCPASLDEHRNRWPLFFEKMPRGLKSFRTTTCGLHVHCSRAPLTHLTIGKMLAFMNQPENRTFIECMAQRTSEQYAKFTDKGVKDARLDDPDRYQAINTVNRDTVEFRLFKGTLRPQSFFKDIEFCDALIHFALPCMRSYKDAGNLQEFLAYVDMHRKEWPNLQGFIQARFRRKASRHTRSLRIPVNAPKVGEL
jgi:hypothetical protein